MPARVRKGVVSISPRKRGLLDSPRLKAAFIAAAKNVRAELAPEAANQRGENRCFRITPSNRTDQTSIFTRTARS